MKNLLAAVVLLAAAATALADIYHLSGGGTLEGETVRQGEADIVIRLGTGTITIGRHMIDRIDSAPSPTAQYKARAAGLAETAEAHAELAEWCEEKYLWQEAQLHWGRAVRLDPDNPSARARLGYVRRDGRWLTRDEARRMRVAEAEATRAGRTKADHTFRQRTREFREQLGELDRTAMSGWAYGDDFTQARQKVLAITDPAAVAPLMETFGRSQDVTKRELLVQALANIANDDAAKQLVDILATDRHAGVAVRAERALAAIDSPAATQMLLNLSRTGGELARNRAALALSAVGGDAAMDNIPQLIRNLVTREQRIIHHEPEGPHRAWFATGTVQAYVADLEPVVAEAAVAFSPVIGYLTTGAVLDVNAVVQPWNEYVWVTVRHASVLDSLRRLTGQDFGWDQRAWQRWYYHQYLPNRGAAGTGSPAGAE